VVSGLDAIFGRKTQKNKTRAKTTAIDQSLRPSGCDPAFGRAVGRFAAGLNAGLKAPL
jgi:hypothetical protein